MKAYDAYVNLSIFLALLQCRAHFVHDKSHTEWQGLNLILSGNRSAADRMTTA